MKKKMTWHQSLAGEEEGLHEHSAVDPRQPTHLKVHEFHELGDLWLQHLHSLLVDLHPVGLFIALYL